MVTRDVLRLLRCEFSRDRRRINPFALIHFAALSTLLTSSIGDVQLTTIGPYRIVRSVSRLAKREHSRESVLLFRAVGDNK